MGARSSQSRGPGLNETDGHLLEYFRNTFGAGGGGNSGPLVPPSGLTATGGIISDYTSGSDVYRAHVFTSSGALNVTALFFIAAPREVISLLESKGFKVSSRS